MQSGLVCGIATWELKGFKFGKKANSLGLRKLKGVRFVWWVSLVTCYSSPPAAMSAADVSA